MASRTKASVIATMLVRAASTEPAEKIGLIGFGEMGSRMAANLISQRGQDLVVCDDRSEALRKAEDLGAEIASTPSSLAQTEGVRVIISMLPTSKAVRDAYLGSRGVCQAAGSMHASLLIDCSTTDPVVSRELAEGMANCGLHQDARPFPDCSAGHPMVLDAPVSGGVAAAADGRLTFMVGGKKEAARAAEPFLAMMGRHNFYCGKNGNGQLAKVANNVALGIQMASIAEAMAFGDRMGVNPKTLAEIFNVSSSRCWSSSDYNPVPGIMEDVPASHDYEGGFACSHMVKDLNIALSTVQQDPEMQLPMTKEAVKLYSKVAEQSPSLDFGAIYKQCYAS